MEFIELAKRRYSSRSYKNISVDDDKILLILNAGRIAPSARNMQPWHFVVIRNKSKLEELAKVFFRNWMTQAPILLFICGDKNLGWVRDNGESHGWVRVEKSHLDIDIAIATDHITLQATELGLATCWICNFDVNLAKASLKLPDNIEPIVLLTLGYPADNVDVNRHAEKRKNLSEIIHWEEF